MLSSLSILSVSLLFVNDVVIDEDLVKRLRLQDIQCQKIILSVGLEEDGIPRSTWIYLTWVFQEAGLQNQDYFRYF